MQLRPSSLPKLALCGQYTGKPHASAEAARGTIIDRIFRQYVTAGWDACAELLEQHPLTGIEIYNIRWAADELHRLANGGFWTAVDEECHLEIPGMPNGGTVDALCTDLLWSADIKTGQHHDYRAQMAAYAIGGMEKTGYDQWDTFIVWIDDPQIERIEWTRKTAERTVAQAMAKVGQPPEVNDYCGWCAHELTCTARLALVEQAQAVTTQDAFLRLLEDPTRLGQFLTAAAVFEKFRDAAKETARELLEAGTPVPGWRLGKPRSSKQVALADLWESNPELSAWDLLRAGGSVTIKEAEQLAGGSVPEALVKTTTTRAPLQKA